MGRSTAPVTVGYDPRSYDSISGWAAEQRARSVADRTGLSFSEAAAALTRMAQAGFSVERSMRAFARVATEVNQEKDRNDWWRGIDDRNALEGL